MDCINKITHVFLIVIGMLIFNDPGNAQVSDSLRIDLPDINVKTIDNRNVNISEVISDGNICLLVFWKSCCPPNIKMLDILNEVYSDWQDQTDVIIYAVSVDDSRNSSKIAPMANGKGWEFTILLDINADLKRAMNVVTTPHLFILDRNRSIIWQKTSFAEGDEETIYEIIQKL